MFNTGPIRHPSVREIDASYEDALRAVTSFQYKHLDLVHSTELPHEKEARFQRELAKNAYLDRHSTPSSSKGSGNNVFARSRSASKERENANYLRARFGSDPTAATSSSLAAGTRHRPRSQNGSKASSPQEDYFRCDSARREATGDFHVGKEDWSADFGNNISGEEGVSLLSKFQAEWKQRNKERRDNEMQEKEERRQMQSRIRRQMSDDQQPSGRLAREVDRTGEKMGKSASSVDLTNSRHAGAEHTLLSSKIKEDILLVSSDRGARGQNDSPDPVMVWRDTLRDRQMITSTILDRVLGTSSSSSGPGAPYSRDPVSDAAFLRERVKSFSPRGGAASTSLPADVYLSGDADLMDTAATGERKLRIQRDGLAESMGTIEGYQELDGLTPIDWKADWRSGKYDKNLKNKPPLITGLSPVDTGLPEHYRQTGTDRHISSSNHLDDEEDDDHVDPQLHEELLNGGFPQGRRVKELFEAEGNGIPSASAALSSTLVKSELAELDGLLKKKCHPDGVGDITPIESDDEIRPRTAQDEERKMLWDDDPSMKKMLNLKDDVDHVKGHGSRVCASSTGRTSTTNKPRRNFSTKMDVEEDEAGEDDTVELKGGFLENRPSTSPREVEDVEDENDPTSDAGRGMSSSFLNSTASASTMMPGGGRRKSGGTTTGMNKGSAAASSSASAASASSSSASNNETRAERDARRLQALCEDTDDTTSPKSLHQKIRREFFRPGDHLATHEELVEGREDAAVRERMVEAGEEGMLGDKDELEQEEEKDRLLGDIRYAAIRGDVDLAMEGSELLRQSGIGGGGDPGYDDDDNYTGGVGDVQHEVLPSIDAKYGVEDDNQVFVIIPRQEDTPTGNPSPTMKTNSPAKTEYNSYNQAAAQNNFSSSSGNKPMQEVVREPMQEVTRGPSSGPGPSPGSASGNMINVPSTTAASFTPASRTAGPPSSAATPKRSLVRGVRGAVPSRMGIPAPGERSGSPVSSLRARAADVVREDGETLKKLATGAQAARAAAAGHYQDSLQLRVGSGVKPNSGVSNEVAKSSSTRVAFGSRPVASGARSRSASHTSAGGRNRVPTASTATNPARNVGSRRSRNILGSSGSGGKIRTTMNTRSASASSSKANNEQLQRAQQLEKSAAFLFGNADEENYSRSSSAKLLSATSSISASNKPSLPASLASAAEKAKSPVLLGPAQRFVEAEGGGTGLDGVNRKNASNRRMDRNEIRNAMDDERGRARGRDPVTLAGAAVAELGASSVTDVEARLRSAVKEGVSFPIEHVDEEEIYEELQGTADQQEMNLSSSQTRNVGLLNESKSAEHDKAWELMKQTRTEQGDLRSIYDLDGRWRSDSGLDIVVRNGVCTWLNLPPQEGSAGPPSVAFTSRQSLAIDGDEYAILRCEYFEGVVCGVRWSDDDYWHRNEKELHDLISKQLKVQALQPETLQLGRAAFQEADLGKAMPKANYLIRQGGSVPTSFMPNARNRTSLWNAGAQETRLDRERLRQYLINEEVMGITARQKRQIDKEKSEHIKTRDRLTAVLRGSRLPMRTKANKNTDVLSLYQKSKKVWEQYPTLKYKNPHDIRMERAGKHPNRGPTSAVPKVKPYFTEAFFVNRDTYATASRRKLPVRQAAVEELSTRRKQLGRQTLFSNPQKKTLGVGP
ncbi:unnamed protein product [Amoebophrya sp. A25]|nr:unnamed protein product [Amoebophrya sp. A25]|eukprot:GSA25T00021091001.1